jgi:hypothetical protein
MSKVINYLGNVVRYLPDVENRRRLHEIIRGLAKGLRNNVEHFGAKDNAANQVIVRGVLKKQRPTDDRTREATSYYAKHSRTSDGNDARMVFFAINEVVCGAVHKYLDWHGTPKTRLARVGTKPTDIAVCSKSINNFREAHAIHPHFIGTVIKAFIPRALVNAILINDLDLNFANWGIANVLGESTFKRIDFGKAGLFGLRDDHLNNILDQYIDGLYAPKEFAQYSSIWVSRSLEDEIAKLALINIEHIKHIIHTGFASTIRDLDPSLKVALAQAQLRSTEITGQSYVEDGIEGQLVQHLSERLINVMQNNLIKLQIWGKFITIARANDLLLPAHELESLRQTLAPQQIEALEKLLPTFNIYISRYGYEARERLRREKSDRSIAGAGDGDNPTSSASQATNTKGTQNPNRSREKQSRKQCWFGKYTAALCVAAPLLACYLYMLYQTYNKKYQGRD